MGPGRLDGGPDFGSRARIRADFGCLREVCFVVNYSVPSSVVDLLSLAMRCVEVKCRAAIAKICIGALESTLSSKNTRIGEPQSQPASKALELDAATAELEATEHHLRFAEGAGYRRRKQAQSHGLQLCEVGEASVAAKAVWAAAESNVQSLFASESVFWAKVGQ